MRYLIALAFALFALPSLAQDCSAATPCSVQGTAAQVNVLTQARSAVNARTCAEVGLPTTCTQAQARARSANANVYSDNQDFVTRYIVAPKFQDLRADLAAVGPGDYCEAWALLSTASKITICTNKGLPTGCDRCP